MANQPEVIRQEMQETRTALTEKLEALEQHVLGTVETATSAVSDTVSTVKDAVEGTVESVRDSIGETVGSVRETFDVELQTRRHPWVLMGAALGAGYISGAALSRLSGRPVHYLPSSAAPAMSRPPAEAKGPGVGAHARSLLETFEPELNKVKGVALGALFNVVKNAVQPYVPHNVQPQFLELVDNVTRKVGGQPLEGSVLEED